MKSKSYRVRWEIDIDAENETEAAEKALEIQRDKGSCALYFDVTEDIGKIINNRIRWVSVDLEQKHEGAEKWIHIYSR